VVIVATWNVENLFRPGGEYGPTTEAAYDAKLDSLSATIATMNPDVLALQEVGDPGALDDLIGRVGGDWEVRLSDLPDDRGIRVGFISRLAIGATEPVDEFPAGVDPVQTDDLGTVMSTMGRGGLRVTVTTGDGAPLEAVTAHLKSKLLTYPGGRFNPRDEDERARYGAFALFRRAAEAATLRSYANGRLAGEGDERRVVVLGDMNDTPEAATTQVLLGPGGSEIGTPGEDRPDAGDPWRLWNLAPLIPEAERYSRIYRGRRELIDHILVSRALLERVTTVRSLVTRRLQSVDDFPTRRRDAPDSDHAPVLATIEQ
jgi:endonuclease/exonuclease/phosphatase family metal-dependent hydrolase